MESVQLTQYREAGMSLDTKGKYSKQYVQTLKKLSVIQQKNIDDIKRIILVLYNTKKTNGY